MGHKPEGHESTEDYAASRNTTIGAALKLLQLDSAKFSADLTQALNVQVRIPKGFTRHRLKNRNDQTIKAQAIKAIGAPKKGWKYFVIEETKATKQIDIRMKSTSGGGGTLAGLVSKAVDLGLNGRTTSAEEANLTKTFEEEHNVLFLAWQVEFKKELGAFPTPADITLHRGEIVSFSRVE